jgi:hypothetical protein
VLSGAAVLLLSTLSHAQCTKDTDCKGDRVCEAGKCVSPALPPAPPPPPGSEAGTAAPGAPAAAAPGVNVGESTAPPTSPEPGAAAAPVTTPPPAPLLVAPAAATAPLPADEPTTHRHSRPAMFAGIMMVSVAPLALLGALTAKNAQDACDADLKRDYPSMKLPTSERYRVDDCNGYSAPLYVLGIGGALLGVGGIPLIVYGARTEPGAAHASVQLQPWAGRDSSGLRLRLEL